MICVVWLCCTGTELSANLAVDNATAEAVAEASIVVNRLAGSGTTGDGGTAAVHPSYPYRGIKR